MPWNTPGISAQLSLRHDIAATRLAGLTARQRQIMEPVLAGHPSKNIAADLGISQRTVENHRAALMKKTGSHSLSALIRLALAADPGTPSNLPADRERVTAGREHFLARRSGADPKSRGAWTSGQQHRFDTGGQIAYPTGVLGSRHQTLSFAEGRAPMLTNQTSRRIWSWIAGWLSL